MFVLVIHVAHWQNSRSRPATIGRDALIRNQLAAARPKDLADVAAVHARRRPERP